MDFLYLNKLKIFNQFKIYTNKFFISKNKKKKIVKKYDLLEIVFN